MKLFGVLDEKKGGGGGGGGGGRGWIRIFLGIFQLVKMNEKKKELKKKKLVQ